MINPIRSCFKNLVVCVCVFLIAKSSFANIADRYYAQAEHSQDPLLRVKLFTKALKENEDNNWPHYFLAFYNRGIALKNMGLYLEALDDLERAVAIYPDLYKAYYAKAEIFTFLENYEEAILAYDYAFIYSLEKNRPLEKRASLYYKVGNYDKAIYDYTIAIKQMPLVRANYYFRALSLIHVFAYEESLKDFNFLLRLEPRNSLYHFLRGVVYYLLYKERELELLRNNYNLQHIYEEPKLLGYRNEANGGFEKAVSLDFDFYEHSQWQSIKRIREDLDSFIDFYIDSSYNLNKNTE